ncbi:MAG: Clp protease N-terminal domain-containing protein, partial [Bacteroidales bacterium]
MNLSNFTIKSQEAIQKAIDLTSANSQQAIEPTHLLKGIVTEGESVVNFLFQKLGVNSATILTIVDKDIESYPRVSGGGEPYLSRESNAVLQKAVELSGKMGDQFVSL